MMEWTYYTSLLLSFSRKNLSHTDSFSSPRRFEVHSEDKKLRVSHLLFVLLCLILFFVQMHFRSWQ